MDMVLVVHGKLVTWLLRQIITIIGLPVGSSGLVKDIFATSAASSIMWGLRQWQMWRRTISYKNGHSKPIHWLISEGYLYPQSECKKLRSTNSGKMMPRVTLTSTEILNSQYMSNVIGRNGIVIQSAEVEKNKKCLTNYNCKNFKVASYLEITGIALCEMIDNPNSIVCRSNGNLICSW